MFNLTGDNCNQSVFSSSIQVSLHHYLNVCVISRGSKKWSRDGSIIIITSSLLLNPYFFFLMINNTCSLIIIINLITNPKNVCVMAPSWLPFRIMIDPYVSTSSAAAAIQPPPIFHGLFGDVTWSHGGQPCERMTRFLEARWWVGSLAFLNNNN